MRRRVIAGVLLLVLLCLTGCASVGEATETNDVNEDELVLIKIYDPMVSGTGFVEGWMGDILAKELGIKVQFLWGQEEGMDSVDIMVHVNNLLFESYLEGNVDEYEGIEHMEWSDEFLTEHGENITKYLQPQIDYVTSLTGGTQCGFVGYAAVKNAEISVVSRDGEYAIADEISGKGGIYTINRNSEHQEEAIALLNWLAKPENTITTFYGPRGLCWDIDENGYYYLTEFGVECAYDYYTQMPEEYGGTFSSGSFSLIKVVWNPDAVIPNSLHGERFDWRTWYLMQEEVR